MNAKNMQLRFPFKLYAMIVSESNSSYSPAVYWTPDGRSFVIRNKHAFMTNLVPQHFKLEKFRSFTRQLNLWGFRSLSENRWYHRHFARGNIGGLHYIQRIKIKGLSRYKILEATRKSLGMPTLSSTSKTSEKDVTSSSIVDGGVLSLESLVCCPQTGDGNIGCSAFDVPPQTMRTGYQPPFGCDASVTTQSQPNELDYLRLMCKILEL
mmetsp:Transcript_32573/g.60038  ORF Transcript_32573/g.60038 Transcript_32573/m.60038 type:complete len:209 (-) Transcript_32573:120-746(-)